MNCPIMSKLPDESNWDFCNRLADSIPPAEIVKVLLKFIKRTEMKKGRMRARPLWSIVGDATTHGSGVSSAIVRKYLGEDVDD